MKRFTILAAVLGLGVSAFIPSVARADRFEGGRVGERVEVRLENDRRIEPVRHEERNRVEVERRVIVEEDYDRACPTAEVPRRVIDAAYDLGNGRQIQSIRSVRAHGRSFYVVHMDARNKVDIDLRIGADGLVVDLDRDPDHNGH